MLLIPGTSLLFSGGKQGVAYLVNRDNMGGLSGSPTADTNIIQSFQVTTDEIHGGAAWWDVATASYAYIWPSSTTLQQYSFNRALGYFALPAAAQSPTAAPPGQRGGLLALTANGTNAGSGILWASHQLVGAANQAVRPGILRAYNAQNVSQELWNSEILSTRDGVGNFAKFVPPTGANGKVYLATFPGRLHVYGLFRPPALSLVLAGTNALLFWPAGPPSGFSLHSNTNLTSSARSSVTNAVIQTNGRFQVTVPLNRLPVFYRLKL